MGKGKSPEGQGGPLLCRAEALLPRNGPNHNGRRRRLENVSRRALTPMLQRTQHGSQPGSGRWPSQGSEISQRTGRVAADVGCSVEGLSDAGSVRRAFEGRDLFEAGREAGEGRREISHVEPEAVAGAHSMISSVCVEPSVLTTRMREPMTWGVRSVNSADRMPGRGP